jgi:hypothetical protein
VADGAQEFSERDRPREQREGEQGGEGDNEAVAVHHQRGRNWPHRTGVQVRLRGERERGRRQPFQCRRQCFFPQGNQAGGKGLHCHCLIIILLLLLVTYCLLYSNSLFTIN